MKTWNKYSKGETTMIIAGIDYSMTSPSICVYASKKSESFSFNKCKLYFLTDTKKYSGTFKNVVGKNFNEWNEDTERFKSISDWAIDVLNYVEQVGLEGYSYNSTGKVFHIAENTGILKYKLYNDGTPYEVYSPSAIKKFATGKGNADKELMYNSFVDETKVDLMELLDCKQTKIGNPVSDIVDSYYVCKKLHSEYRSKSS